MRFEAAPHWVSGTIVIALLLCVTPFVLSVMLLEPVSAIASTLLAVAVVMGAEVLFSPAAYELRDGDLVVIGHLGARIRFHLSSARVSSVPPFVGRLGSSRLLGFVGWAWTADWSCIVMLASNPDFGIELETTHRPVVISPADPDAFKAGLASMMS